MELASFVVTKFANMKDSSMKLHPLKKKKKSKLVCSLKYQNWGLGILMILQRFSVELYKAIEKMK